MADFRKWLYAFALVALLAGLTIPANAQSTTITCTVTANTPLVRGEEYTALAGDIQLHCSGGITTAIGALIPKVDVTVIMSVPITSKLTDTTDSPAFNEALLLIDEPGSSGSTVPLLNCGNNTGGVIAPYSAAPNAAPFTCDVTSNAGTGDATSYNGTTTRPNVFQGRQVANSQGFAIQFLGIPVDAPGPVTATAGSGNRTIRITNVRVNAASLGILAGQSFNAPSIITQITLNGTNFGGNQVITAPVAVVRPGLIVGSGTNIGEGTATFLQCSATAGTVTNTITLTEGFSTAFKVRNWQQISVAPEPVLR